METMSVAADTVFDERRVASSAVMQVDADVFRDAFNRRAFLVSHTLSRHPLFTLPRLVELSKRLPEHSIAYNAGDVSVAEGLYGGPRTGLGVEETIRRIEECRSWMVLKLVESDPQYRTLLDTCLDEIDRLSARRLPGIGKRAAFIFISSPRSVTPFHIDPEYNFLLQIRGTKTVNAFDPADRAVLSEEDLERFYAADSDNAKLRFKEEYRTRATAFELSPGMGLHLPVTAPHWVENGDAVSISFSVTFGTVASERRSMIYAANARLRRLGVQPSPFGRSAVRDAAKCYGFRALRRARRILAIGDSPAGARR
jgi:hypothetical protein